MSALLTLAQLLVTETKEAIYARGLQIATTVGLPVTSWAPGDATREDFHFISEVMATVEAIVAKYVAGGFLDLAAQLDETKWLKALAYQVYGYEAQEATYATCTVRLSNGGGGYYDFEVGRITVKNSSTGATYHSTATGVLTDGPGTTVDIDFVADVSGTDGSASIGDIDTMVTAFPNVTCSNTTAAVGQDEESRTSIVAGCRNKLESLSPNGAAGAYAYVALNANLTGASDVTRARVIGDSTTGNVTVYVASSSGAVSGPDLALVEAAIVTWALPQCITLTCSSASAYPVVITYSAKVYDTVGETVGDIEDAIEAALGELFASIPIGGDGDAGKLSRARIVSAINNAFPGYVFDVVLSAPASDVTLSTSQVATLSTVTPTVTLESMP